MRGSTPSWLSLIASLTTRSPRRFRLCRNSVQNGPVSECPTFSPSTSRFPSLYTPTATMAAAFTMRQTSRVWMEVASSYRYRPKAKPGQEELKPSAGERSCWLFGSWVMCMLMRPFRRPLALGTMSVSVS